MNEGLPINHPSKVVPQNIYSQITNNVFNSNQENHKTQKNDLLSDDEDKDFSNVDNDFNPNLGPDLPGNPKRTPQFQGIGGLIHK